MDDERIQFASLIRAVRDGSEEAAWVLVERYGDHILRAVRRRLSTEIRSKFDSIDFVQAVWASFFACSQKLQEISTPDELMALLAAIARNKVVSEMRRRLETTKRSVRCEEVLPPSDLRARGADTPSAIAVAREQWRALLDNQPSHYRRIAALRLAGETQSEIANQLCVSERTVRRVLVRLLSTIDD